MRVGIGLLLLLASPSFACAQERSLQAAKPRWLFGASAGYERLFPNAFKAGPQGATENGDRAAPFCFGPPSEVAISGFVGKPLGTMFHADALLSGQAGDDGNICFGFGARGPAFRMVYQGHTPGDNTDGTEHSHGAYLRLGFERVIH